jgi:hypothetical protein
MGYFDKLIAVLGTQYGPLQRGCDTGFVIYSL